MVPELFNKKAFHAVDMEEAGLIDRQQKAGSKG